MADDDQALPRALGRAAAGALPAVALVVAGAALVAGVDHAPASEPAGTTPAETPTRTTPTQTPNWTTPTQTPAPDPDRHEVAFPTARGTVLLDCTTLVVDLAPASQDYVLRLTYRHTGTGRQVRFLAGPMNGRIRDAFGGSGLLLVEVVVHLSRRHFAVFYAPGRCR